MGGYYGSPRISSEFLDCSLPCTFDSYSLCVVPGTIISMGNGVNKVIEDVKVGETVISFSLNRETIISNEVNELHVRDYDGEIVELELISGKKLLLSPEHPVFVKEIGWIKASKLLPNWEVLSI